MGCVATSPSSSSSFSRALPRRKWSTQTEVSTRITHRPGSAAGEGAQLGRGAAQRGQHAGAFARDQFPERAMNQFSLLANTGEPAGLSDQTIVQVERRPHTRVEGGLARLSSAARV